MSLSSNIVIIIGLCLSFAGTVALSWGFLLKGEERALSREEVIAKYFSLAESTFDLKLLVPNDGGSKPVISKNGTINIIVDIRDHSSQEALGRFHLSGDWYGDTGIISNMNNTVVTFSKIEQAFTVMQARPFIEIIKEDIRDLKVGNKYDFDIMGFPGVAIPLTPKLFVIRTKFGVVYTIGEFRKSSTGWYTGTLSL